MQSVTPILSHRDFLKIDKDYQAAASVVNLHYVSDKEPGITRIRKGKSFTYRFRNRAITDAKSLERIKGIVIPPAWERVWICADPNGHIQATGYDVRGRKQYRYHPRWSIIQHETKFHRMYEFGKALPQLRKKIEKDLGQQGAPESKILATVVGIMEKTFIRVGNEGYEKLYGSYGLTTMKNNHVDIKGDQITFSFKGKKGVYHKVKLKSRKFARNIRQCKALPGKELFQYVDAGGELRKIDSGQVNAYLKDCLEMDFTTKDFRTWAGTLSMLQYLRDAPPCKTKMEYQRTINTALKDVSARLGNTVAVCRKYYVHPELLRMYREEELADVLCRKTTANEFGLNPEEELLMSILKIIQKNKVQLAVA